MLIGSTTAPLRGGFGIFFDNRAAAIQLPQNYQGSWPDTGQQQAQNLNGPDAPYVNAQNPFGNSAGTLPAATPFTHVNYFVAPHIKNPYSNQWNFGMEHQFGQSTILSVGYGASESHRLDIGGYFNTAAPGTSGNNAARRPYSYIVPTRYDRNWSNGSYNALRVSLAKRFTSDLAYQVAYTWNKTIDEGPSGCFGVEGNALQDAYNFRGSRSVSAYDIPRPLTINLNYELPIGKGKRFSTRGHIVDYIVGDWQANPIFTARSGQPYTITTSGDSANTGNINYERPNLLGDPALAHPTTSQWFNTAAFAIPSGGIYGNLGRNTMRSSNLWNLDFSVFRQFPTTERMGFELGSAAFNLPNTVICGTPNASIRDKVGFGYRSGTGKRSANFAACGEDHFLID